MIFGVDATPSILDAWASTFPWDCLVPGTTSNCCSADHDHDPMVNDPCAVPGCGQLLLADEVCYAVTQYKRVTGPPPQNPAGRVRVRERWICWRHISPDKGPQRVPRD